MSLPETPKRGMLLTWSCIECDKLGRMEVTGISKKSQNEDGSFCYTLKAKCPNCGYINGRYRPIWYNFYRKGALC